MLSLASFPEKT